MSESEDETEASVAVSMELTGDYEEVLAKLATSGSGREDLTVLTDDLTMILETVERIEGGTRSSIAEHLPDDMAVEYDAEGVVPVLQTLERYGLVALEGNTWYPGQRPE